MDISSWTAIGRIIMCHSFQSFSCTNNRRRFEWNRSMVYDDKSLVSHMSRLIYQEVRGSHLLLDPLLGACRRFSPIPPLSHISTWLFVIHIHTHIQSLFFMSMCIRSVLCVYRGSKCSWDTFGPTASLKSVVRLKNSGN